MTTRTDQDRRGDKITGVERRKKQKRTGELRTRGVRRVECRIQQKKVSSL